MFTVRQMSILPRLGSGNFTKSKTKMKRQSKIGDTKKRQTDRQTDRQTERETERQWHGGVGKGERTRKETPPPKKKKVVGRPMRDKINRKRHCKSHQE